MKFIEVSCNNNKKAGPVPNKVSDTYGTDPASSLSIDGCI